MKYPKKYKLIYKIHLLGNYCFVDLYFWLMWLTIPKVYFKESWIIQCFRCFIGFSFLFSISTLSYKAFFLGLKIYLFISLFCFCIDLILLSFRSSTYLKQGVSTPNAFLTINGPRLLRFLKAFFNWFVLFFSVYKNYFWNIFEIILFVAFESWERL